MNDSTTNPFQEALRKKLSKAPAYASFILAAEGFKAFISELKNVHERVALNQSNPSFGRTEALKEAEEMADFDSGFDKLLEDFEAGIQTLFEDLATTKGVSDTAHDTLQADEPDYYNNVYLRGDE